MTCFSWKVHQRKLFCSLNKSQIDIWISLGTQSIKKRVRSSNEIVLLKTFCRFPKYQNSHWILNVNFFKYIGIPISLGACNSESWSKILNKFKNKIRTWGAKWITIVRRVVLVKLVSSSLPIYLCSSLLAPKFVLIQMSISIHKFLS